jgi:hypothetical protein
MLMAIEMFDALFTWSIENALSRSGSDQSYRPRDHGYYLSEPPPPQSKQTLNQFHELPAAIHNIV